LKKVIEKAVEQLPEKYRIIFMLREVENVAVAEVAELLGITQPNVKIRSHRAKQMLRGILSAEINSMGIFEFHKSRCTIIAIRVMSIINTQFV
jgi:RNA polymerase sigma-70 factor (ECF subfamily)